MEVRVGGEACAALQLTVAALASASDTTGRSAHTHMCVCTHYARHMPAPPWLPACVLRAAGYDAHWADPLAGLQLRTATYHWLCGALAALAGGMESCGGRVVLVLEGGYHRDSLQASVRLRACMHACAH